MKEELSIDNLDAEIKTNRDLYDQLNKITEIEAVDPYDSNENEVSNVAQNQKFFLRNMQLQLLSKVTILITNTEWLIYMSQV